MAFVADSSSRLLGSSCCLASLNEVSNTHFAPRTAVTLPANPRGGRIQTLNGEPTLVCSSSGRQSDVHPGWRGRWANPNSRGESFKVAAVRTAVEEEVPLFLLEEAFEKDYVPAENESESTKGKETKGSKRKDRSGGSSTMISGVKLENVSKTFKGVTVLKDVSWEVKRGERVGLVGINGAGKTTQLNIIAGKEEADSGNVVKARANMKIAFLSQEFEVVGSRTLREEFMSTFASEMDISAQMEKVQVIRFNQIIFLSVGYD